MGKSKYNASVFSEYRNKYQGKTAALLCTGPTLNKFKRNSLPPDTYYCGVNAILYKTLDLDFYFFGDKHDPPKRSHPYIATHINKLPQKTGRFASVYRDGTECSKSQVSANYAKNTLSALCFEDTIVNALTFNADISQCRLSCHSVAFQALQFLLFAGFSTIYLIGADCGISKAKGSHFTGKIQDHRYANPGRMRKLIGCWRRFREFSKKHYPITQIISVNPIGLKNVFPFTTTTD